MFLSWVRNDQFWVISPKIAFQCPRIDKMKHIHICLLSHKLFLIFRRNLKLWLQKELKIKVGHLLSISMEMAFNFSYLILFYICR